MKDWQKLALVIIIGILLFVFLYPKNNNTDPMIIEKPVYYEDLEKIHNLENIIQDKENQISELKNNVGEIREVLVVQKEKLKLLEPDSGVLVLREFLEEYSGEPMDSLPTLINDSMIAIDNTDLININIVFLDHKAEGKIIEKQAQIISLDSTIKLDYESIIRTDENIRTNLESALTKQKKTTEVWRIVGITGITLSTVLILINIW
jgi:flagellar biosynthesis chaperone FliJ